MSSIGFQAVLDEEESPGPTECDDGCSPHQVSEYYPGAFPYSFDFLYWEEVPKRGVHGSAENQLMLMLNH